MEAILNFQQMIIDLTGMEIANASLLDEATVAAGAMAMSRRISKSESTSFFVDDECHPQTIAVVRSCARYFGFDVIVGDPFLDLQGKKVFGVLLQYPGTSGIVRDLYPLNSKQDAFYPMVILRDDKYWPPVGRIDNLYGDRNLSCSCPPMEEYSEEIEERR